jgi:hypothetical protein
MPAARSSWVARLSDPRIVLAVAIALLVSSVAGLTVRLVVGMKIDVAGTVIDARTKQPVAGAHVVAMGIHERSDSSGAFTVRDVPRGTELRFSADDHRHADAEASADPMRVALAPIPVTGKVESAFTSEGMGATVRGKETTRTKSDGTFTTYGIGPGDTVTVTAFGHAPKKVKVPGSRKIEVALELGRLNPDALIKPVAGYGFADMPGDATASIRAELNAIDPALGSSVTGAAARSITKGGKGIGVVIVVAFDPKVAVLPGVQDAYLDGFAAGATKTKDVTIGKTRTRFIQVDSFVTGYAWQRFAGFVQVLTEKPADAKVIAENLIGARTAVPTESV